MSVALVWHTQLPDSAVLTPACRRLLLAPSLTAVLRAKADFSVVVRHLGCIQAKPDVLIAWGLPAGQAQVYVREVYLCLCGTPVVWAVSVCVPQADFWVPYLQCGTQPLGARLFDGSRDFVRSPLQYAYGSHLGCPDARSVWARRSVFRQAGQDLRLTEVFLPALHQWFA